MVEEGVQRSLKLEREGPRLVDKVFGRRSVLGSLWWSRKLES